LQTGCRVVSEDVRRNWGHLQPPFDHLHQPHRVHMPELTGHGGTQPMTNTGTFPAAYLPLTCVQVDANVCAIAMAYSMADMMSAYSMTRQAGAGFLIAVRGSTSACFAIDAIHRGHYLCCPASPSSPPKTTSPSPSLCLRTALCRDTSGIHPSHQGRRPKKGSLSLHRTLFASQQGTFLSYNFLFLCLRGRPESAPDATRRYRGTLLADRRLL
jgi:hypothetical protein